MEKCTTARAVRPGPEPWEPNATLLASGPHARAGMFEGAEYEARGYYRPQARHERIINLYSTGK